MDLSLLSLTVVFVVLVAMACIHFAADLIDWALRGKGR